MSAFGSVVVGGFQNGINDAFQSGSTVVVGGMQQMAITGLDCPLDAQSICMTQTCQQFTWGLQMMAGCARKLLLFGWDMVEDTWVQNEPEQGN